MQSRLITRVRAFAAAASVIVGAAAGLFINIVSGHPTWATIGGTAAVVLAWAALEWWRTNSSEEKRYGVIVSQRVRRLGAGNRLIGMRQSVAAKKGAVNVSQRVGVAEEKSEIIGYDGDPT